MSTKTKIYGFFNSMEEFGDAAGYAISEHGHVIAHHVSSNESFCRSDLGMNGFSTSKHNIYDEAFPEGWVSEFVSIKDRDNHEGLKNALRLHDEQPLDEGSQVDLEELDEEDDEDVEENHPYTAVLTTQEIRNLAEFAGFTIQETEETSDEDFLSNEIGVLFNPVCKIADDDGIQRYYPIVAYDVECPDEGVTPISDPE